MVRRGRDPYAVTGLHGGGTITRSGDQQRRTGAGCDPDRSITTLKERTFGCNTRTEIGGCCGQDQGQERHEKGPAQQDRRPGQCPPADHHFVARGSVAVAQRATSNMGRNNAPTMRVAPLPQPRPITTEAVSSTRSPRSVTCGRTNRTSATRATARGSCARTKTTARVDRADQSAARRAPAASMRRPTRPINRPSKAATNNAKAVLGTSYSVKCPMWSAANPFRSMSVG